MFQINAVLLNFLFIKEEKIEKKNYITVFWSNRFLGKHQNLLSKTLKLSYQPQTFEQWCNLQYLYLLDIFSYVSLGNKVE